MVGKPAFVPFILAAIPGTSAATVAQVSLDQFPSGILEAVIATEEAKLTASDAADGDVFGYSVALSGDTAVVGAWNDDHAGGESAGSAYVFTRSGTTWSEQQKLTASDPAAGEWFGISVALSGDTVVVGASQDHGSAPFAGAAYVFVRSGTSWTEQQKLTASDAAAGDGFGISVALSGDTAVVGADHDDFADGHTQGSAYVFVRSGVSWGEQQKLTASDAASIDSFGQSVAISGDTAVIGAQLDDFARGDAQGSAYVFTRSGTTWSEQQKLTASDATDGAWFGYSVGTSGDTVVIGAPYEDNSGGTTAGSAYVFVRQGTSWSEQQKLTASDASSDDVFGTSVSLSGDTVIVGAPTDDNGGGPNGGSAYLFVRSGTVWTEEAKLIASDAEVGAWFGRSVAASGERVLVGGYAETAYVFRLSTEPVSYCTAGTSASGCQALLSSTGTPSATATSGFTLSASTVEGQKDGLFFFGTNGQQANPWGNGTSYQCVIPPVVRTPTMPGVGTIGLCDGSFALDLNALWCPSCPSPAKNPGAGATVQAQLWYRDPLSTSNQTTSLSDAIEFVVAP